MRMQYGFCSRLELSKLYLCDCATKDLLKTKQPIFIIADDVTGEACRD